MNFVDAMEGSWSLASGHRLELFALAVVILLAGLVASIPGFLLGLVAPALGVTLGVVGRAAVAVFGIASAARAYDQLREGREPPADAEPAPPEEPDYEGALSADDLPPPDGGS